MIDLSRFFLNPFNDPAISIDELVDYSTEHLQRMVANNPGAQFNTRVNQTTVALAALESTVTTEKTKLALQKGKTLAKDSFRRALPGHVARIHGAAVAAFGLHSPPLMECFPLGREVFGDCNDSALENHLQQLITCLTPHAALVGQSQLDNAAGLLSTWTALYANAATARGVTNFSAEARRAASGNLRLELFKNLLALATAFPDQQDKAALYCPQHLLEDHPVVADLPVAVNE